MDKKIVDLLEQGVTIITPTQRLARHLRFQFGRQQLAGDKRVWPSPDCLPWTAWCKRSFERVVLRSEEKPLLLNQFQQHFLWQQIINDSRYNDRLLHIAATTRQALHAYQLCKAWSIPIFPETYYLSDDHYAFSQWANDYEKQKLDQHFIDESGLPDYLIACSELKALSLKPILFYGFDTLTTQQKNLIKSLEEAGIEIIHFQTDSRNQLVEADVQEKTASEILSAAYWARQKLEQDPQATIGIVSLDLNKSRETIERIFDSVFEPGTIAHQQQTSQRCYSISLGRELSYYPLIHTALQLLSLTRRVVTLAELGNLLHSPFISGASSEQNQRAMFYAALRRVGEQRIGFKSLYWLHEHRCEAHEQCEQFIGLIKSFEIAFLSHTRTQSLRQWAITISNWLTGFGWPGERPLNSDEHQLVSAWQDALMRLGSLDTVNSTVGFSEALYQLKRILAETRFQPETPETPIQILGMTGAAAMQFDYLWVMGLQDDNWPEPLKPNPFIPLACQRDFNMPMADAESQLNLARQTTQQLIDSATEIVFSYVTQEGDREYRPSPLIKPYLDQGLQNNINELEDYKHSIFASSKHETFIDTEAPPISKGETVSGGSALFKDQAACPFRAFARHRLHAQALQQVDVGLNAIERGNLAHRSLQFLWQRLKSSAELDYKSQAEIDELIKSVVNEAVKQQTLQQPETFTERFTQLEQQRLYKLLQDWLDIERQRSDFKVLATEQWQNREFEGIELHLRVDRIDELLDGRYVIIDYKTGNVSKADWESQNPNDPQLPLYAVTSEQDLAAIAYASLKPGKLGYVGYSDGEELLPSVKPHRELPWQEQLDIWNSVLMILANDFRGGKAIVEPTLTACRYCDLHALCRINERIENPEPISDEVSIND